MQSFRQDIISIAKQSLVYGAGLWATSAAGFVLVPIYVRHLSPYDYGLLELLNRATDVVLGFALSGLVVAVLRSYHLYETPEERNSVVSGALVFVLMTSLAAQAGVMLFARSLSTAVLGSPAYASLLCVACLRVIIDVGQLVPGTLLRVREQVTFYTALSVTRFVLSILLNLWFVAAQGRGLWGVVEANLLSGLAVALVSTGYCVRTVGVRVSLPVLKPMVLFGLPLALGDIPGMVVANLDRYLLLHQRSAADVGVYALAGKFGMLLSMALFQPFIFVYSAFMFRVATRDDASHVYGRVFTLLAATAVWVLAVLSLFAGDIVRLVSSDRTYTPVGAIAAVVLFSSLLLGIGPMLEVGIYLKKRTFWKPLIYSVQAGANVALCCALIPRWGPLGAAWAAVGTQIVSSVGLYVVSQRLFRITYEWTRVLAIAIAAVACVALGMEIAGRQPHLLSVLLRAALLVGLTAVIAAAAAPAVFAGGRRRLVAAAAGAARRLAVPLNEVAGPLIHAAWRFHNSVLIVRYHSVSDPGDPTNPIPPGICTRPDVFRLQMQELAARATPISLEYAVSALEAGRRLPPRAVVVTFDDGFADNRGVALPILLACGVPAAFFVTTGWVDRGLDPWFVVIREAFLTSPRPTWSSPSGEQFTLDCEEARHAARRAAARVLTGMQLPEQLSWIGRLHRELEVEPARRSRPLMMSWHEVARLRDAGMVIGSHTVGHPNLARLSREAQEAELRASVAALTARLGSRVEYLSYPDPIGHPNFNDDSLKVVERIGFRAALSTLPGLARPRVSRLALPRTVSPSADARIGGFSGCFLRAALRRP